MSYILFSDIQRHQLNLDPLVLLIVAVIFLNVNGCSVETQTTEYHVLVIFQDRWLKSVEDELCHVVDVGGDGDKSGRPA